MSDTRFTSLLGLVLATAIALFAPAEATAKRASDALAALPARTDWAIGVAEPAQLLRHLEVGMYLMGKVDRSFPPPHRARQKLRKELGFDPLSVQALKKAGFDPDRGAQIHGLAAGLFDGVPRFTLAFGVQAGGHALGWLTRWLGRQGLQAAKPRKIGRTQVTLLSSKGRESVAVYERQGWLHLSIGGTPKAAMGEAKRALRGGKRLGARKDYRGGVQEQLAGHDLVGFLGMKQLMAAYGKAVKRDAKAAKKSGEQWRIRRTERDLVTHGTIAAVFDGVDAFWGGMAFGATRLEGSLDVAMTRRAVKAHRALLPRGRHRGFDLQRLSNANPGVLAAQFDLRQALDGLFRLSPELKTAWDQLALVAQRAFNANLDRDVVAAFRDHVVYVFHGVEPLSEEELKAERIPKLRLFGQVQHALLARVDGAKLRPMLETLSGLARRFGLKVDRRMLGPWDVFTVDMNVRVGVSVHLVLGNDTIAIGTGPGIPELVIGWLEPGGTPRDLVLHAAGDMGAVLAQFSRFLRPSVVAKLRLQSVKRDFDRAKAALRQLHRGAMTIAPTARGYRLSGWLTHD